MHISEQLGDRRAGRSGSVRNNVQNGSDLVQDRLPGDGYHTDASRFWKPRSVMFVPGGEVTMQARQHSRVAVLKAWSDLVRSTEIRPRHSVKSLT